MPLLSVHNLRTYFNTDDAVVKAVDGVSFELNRGETLAIVGESGSGKSVTSLSIMRLVPTPPAFFAGGVITFSDENLMHASPKRMRQLRGNRLAMIFQDPMTALNPYLTVRRQLTEVLETHKGATPKRALTQSLDMLQQVGISDPERRIHDYPHQFSGGMRQRVMIAMALLCEPELLIADEPTTALDVTIQAQILELLRNLQTKRQTSMILITHDLAVVAGMAQRVLVMYAGRVVEEASIDDLFANPQHPYTRGLLHSIPRHKNGHTDAQLTPIPGLPPDLSQLPKGCPFQPRCSVAQARCATAYPPVITVGGPQHTSACWQHVP